MRPFRFAFSAIPSSVSRRRPARRTAGLLRARSPALPPTVLHRLPQPCTARKSLGCVHNERDPHPPRRDWRQDAANGGGVPARRSSRAAEPPGRGATGRWRGRGGSGMTRKTARDVPRAQRGRRAAAELAALLEELCGAGIRHRETGWCTGDVRGLAGVPPPPRPGVAPGPPGDPRRYTAHLRRGHDGGCPALGIPRASVERLLRSRDSVGASALLLEAFDEAVRELSSPSVEWSGERAREAVAHAVRTRITPAGHGAGGPTPTTARPRQTRRPRPPRGEAAADGMERCVECDGSGRQMPRFASNSPASRRFFTCVRNRAASAPSTMR